jgi:hypothetical protein
MPRGACVVCLSDAELDAVLNAAKPIHISQRSAFMRDVASELSRHGEIGPGLVHGVASELQQQYLSVAECTPRKPLPARMKSVNACC